MGRRVRTVVVVAAVAAVVRAQHECIPRLRRSARVSTAHVCPGTRDNRLITYIHVISPRTCILKGRQQRAVFILCEDYKITHHSHRLSEHICGAKQQTNPVASSIKQQAVHVYFRIIRRSLRRSAACSLCNCCCCVCAASGASADAATAAAGAVGCCLQRGRPGAPKKHKKHR